MPDTKSNLLYDSIYIVFWQRENYNNIKTEHYLPDTEDKRTDTEDEETFFGE